MMPFRVMIMIIARSTLVIPSKAACMLIRLVPLLMRAILPDVFRHWVVQILPSTVVIIFSVQSIHVIPKQDVLTMPQILCALIPTLVSLRNAMRRLVVWKQSSLQTLLSTLVSGTITHFVSITHVKIMLDAFNSIMIVPTITQIVHALS